ncbi:uncharacterized protein TNCV_2241801 [Trichonephila clavipes]|nr:uncharacterized protein TNCV_2241801 [Trichonephila clavipes]
MLGGAPGLHRTQFEDLSRSRIGVLRKSTGGEDKKSVDSVTTLATDLGIDPEFPISKLRKKVYLFAYEGSDEPASNSFQQFAIASAN